MDDSDAICTDYQILLIDCCTESFPLSDESYETTMGIDPFVVKFVGDFELTDDNTILIINVINELISPYLIVEVGKVLNRIDIGMTFMEEESVVISSAYAGQNLQSSSAALVEVKGSLDLEGASQDQVNMWTEQQVTVIVKNFFSVAHLRDELLDALVKKGLDLKEIVIHDGNADAIVTDEGSSTQSSNQGNGDSDGDGSNQNSTWLIVAAICGGIVCLVIAVALFTNIKRRRRRRFGSARGSMSTSDTDTFNLRSGNDDLPDSNTSVASAHDVSFPDVFDNTQGGKLNNDNVASERWCSEPGASESDISLGQLLGDYNSDELNRIEDDAVIISGH